MLQHAFLRLRLTGVHTSIDEILQVVGLKSDEIWWIDAVCQVQPEWADRRTITDAEAHSVHHIVEILQIALRLPQREGVDRGIDVPKIVEQDSSDVLAD